MQNRLSLIIAFVVLAVVSCLLGVVLMPNSSIGGEKDPQLQPVNFQEQEPATAQQEAAEVKPKEEPQPAEIDTDVDVTDTSLYPIEKDMHEFMEYVFQPAYKRIKVAMESEPAADNNAAWKAIKADALTLAEGGNLILMRAPEDDKDIWNIHSVKVRGHGRVMYQAARAKNFRLASQHYILMINSCNACHLKFAGGEHILTP